MFGQMKELMEMKKHADQLKRELEAVTIDVTEVSGIKMEIDGAQKFRSVSIDPNFLKPENKSRIEADILRSINAAIKKAQAVAAQKMSSMMPGL